MANKSYWITQKKLEYKSRLQRANNGCPWPASVIALVKSANSVNHKDQRALESAKLTFCLNDEDIMLLLSCFESKDFNNPFVLELINKKIKKNFTS